MKIAILAPILGCLAAFVSADAKTACGIKSPTAMHAIRNFCAKTDSKFCAMPFGSKVS